ncbi:hypothetical protein D918_06957 [Trichuris suis]|nr:hypothetical protein D918_06957 [Trichuris suis]
MTKALPSTRLRIDGVSRNVLVDTGCTTCVAHVSGCKRWTRRPVALLAVNGKELECQGMGEVGLERPDGGRATVEAIVVDAKPLGFDFILGMNGIEALGGVFVSKGPRVSFGPESAPVCSAGVVPVRLEERDFTVAFDPVKRVWTAAWKWTGSEGPALLKNSVKEYPPNPRIRASYEAEVEKWVDKGWLVPYDARRHGQAKGLIPLMADQPGAAPYVVGEKVWIKPPGARCVSTYHQGTVTAVLSRHAVEVDGTPRHVRDLRHRMAPEETHEQVPPGDDPNDELVLHFTRPEAHSMPVDEEPLATTADEENVIRELDVPNNISECQNCPIQPGTFKDLRIIYDLSKYQCIQTFLIPGLPYAMDIKVFDGRNSSKQVACIRLEAILTK